MSILESDKAITPYRAGQLADLAGDLAKRMTTSKYGYLTWDEVDVVMETLKTTMEESRKKGEF